MYRIFLLLIIIISFTVFGQKTTKIPTTEKSAINYPIAGSDLLREENIRVAKFLKENPDYLVQSKLNRPAAWGFTTGSKKSWLAHNFTTENDYPIPSTCKAVGTNCYIFVADDVWGTNVDSSAVLAVVNDFDNQTPANSNKGIYQTNVETFGNPPDVDNDSKIIILILDILDGYSGSGGYIAGYFSSGNEVRSGGLAAEIYFMDANPVNLETPSGLRSASSTAAHEFQHMINWNYHKTSPELTFINEGLSKVSEIVCGYGASMQSLFANEPNHYLFDWRTNDNTIVLNDYARAQRFFLYLMEQLGIESLKSFVQSYNNYGLAGIEGFKKILGNYSTSLGKIFLNFSIANGLNNITVNPAFGYSYPTIPVTTGTTFYDPNVNKTTSTLQNLGAEYFTFSGSPDFNITFTAAGSNIIVKAIETGMAASRVVDVPLNNLFTEPEYPSTYNTVRFIAIDTNQTSTQVYQYQSSGTSGESASELKWDISEPTGYFSLTANDTVCVTFDAFPGGKLDSIKVALARAGSITGGVWEYTGVQNPTPLGKKLAVPITASINTNAQIVNSNSKYPYNKPFTNWSTIDLSSYNISTDKPFAVGFVIGQNPAVPGVLVTDFASSGSYHSYTYLQTSDQVPSPGWYYITTGQGGDTIAIYLIRAYVSLSPDTIDPEIEIIPDDYFLFQNFPNPFNPGTTIYFVVPKTGYVSLKVYNSLGQEISTLVEGIKEGGTSHQVKFDGTNLGSGVYFYKLESGYYKEVKKMILIK